MHQLNLPIGGFIRQSLIDYPGNIASVIFLSGCNMRCYYCHNPQLVLPRLIKNNSPISVNEIMDWIEKNADLLDAVVITGGEPTLHPSFPDFLRILKRLSLSIKLDTNGTNSRMIEYLIGKRLIDYVAMDIKAPLRLEKYREICGPTFTEQQLQEIKKSVDLLINGGVDYEFRTTLNASLSLADIRDIISAIKGRYYLQMPNENNRTVLDPLRMGKVAIDASCIPDLAATMQQVTLEVR